MPRGCLQFVIVVFPDHTHLLFLDYEGFYYLIYIFSINNEVRTCNISMERKICRLHDGIKHD